MSDEFEDISVAETEPMEIASVEPAMTPAVAEALPAEVEATQINLDPADEALKNNSQQAYTETYAPDRLNEGATPITASAIAAREEEKEAKRNEAFEHHQAQLKQVEARNEFLNKDHDFGGMKMSGADLEKLMNFISNPQMQDKLRERLGKSGMPKEKIDKGMKELNEYIELKKKEQEGKLSEEDQRRLREINKSEDFKVVAQDAERLAREQGVQFSKEYSTSMQTARISEDKDVRQTSKGDVREMQAQHASLTSKDVNGADAVSLEDPEILAQTTHLDQESVVTPKTGLSTVAAVASLDSQEIATKSTAYVAASARDELPQTVALTKEFTDTNARQIAAAAKPESLLALAGNEPVSLAATANNNVIVAKSQRATVVASL